MLRFAPFLSEKTVFLPETDSTPESVKSGWKQGFGALVGLVRSFCGRFKTRSIYWRETGFVHRFLQDAAETSKTLRLGLLFYRLNAVRRCLSSGGAEKE